jgi:hypothetical protein
MPATVRSVLPRVPQCPTCNHEELEEAVTIHAHSERIDYSIGKLRGKIEI